MGGNTGLTPEQLAKMAQAAAQYQFKHVEVPDKTRVAKKVRLEVFPASTNTDKAKGLELQQSQTSNVAPEKLRIAKKSILYIMDNDKACRNIDKQAQAERIARIALDVGVQPEVIGAIIKQETHFSTTASDMNKGNGVGPMQVTNINIRDMYIRPEAYDPEIKRLIGPKDKPYKSFAEALKAKLKDPHVDLGAFGNKFFEFYKQNQVLFDKYNGSTSNVPKNVKDTYMETLTNYDMNVYLGCWIYKAKLKNNTEWRALRDYNGDKKLVKYDGKMIERKVAYANEVNDTLIKVRSNTPELKNI